MANTITLDEALAQLGGFGLFQWLLYLGASIAEMAVTYQTFLLTFITTEPKWICRNESVICKAHFKRRILHVPNAIQTIHNEKAYLIIYCLNCIRCMENSTFEMGLILVSL